jgi:hypothetical protein
MSINRSHFMRRRPGHILFELGLCGGQGCRIISAWYNKSVIVCLNRSSAQPIRSGCIHQGITRRKMMKPRQVLIAITVVLVLFLGLAPALAQQGESPQSSNQPSGRPSSGTGGTGGMQMPPPGGGMGGMHMPPPGGGICTDGKYLFVLQGPFIQQYTIPDLQLKNTVELPRPKPPEMR